MDGISLVKTTSAGPLYFVGTGLLVQNTPSENIFPNINYTLQLQPGVADPFFHK